MPGRSDAAFADSFMRGFSFVDEIKRRKKADARLEVRLEEERGERAFQKERTRENDRFVREDRSFTSSERSRIEEERGKREQGEQLALNPDATDEELLPFAAFSPGAKAEMERRIGKERLSEALGQAKTIPTAAGAGASNQATSSPSRPSLSDVIGDPQQQQQLQPPPTQAQTGAASPEFTFGADRSEASLQEIDIDDALKFSPEHQQRGFFGKIGSKIAGTASEITRGTEDLVAGAFNAPGRIRGAVFGEDINPATQNAGDEFGGNLQVPADRFTSEPEFAEMAAAGASQQEISAARDSNVEVLSELERIGNRPSSMALDAYSQQGRLLEGSDRGRKAAEIAGRKAETRATAFLDPTINSPMEDLALENPRAATVMYLQDRATLQGRNPGLAEQMDKRMLPILNQAESDMQTETANLDPNTPNGRKQRAALGNLQHSRDQISRGQPSINKQAGINSSGVKIGDTERVSDVAETIYDPERPVPTQNTNAAINTAATIAQRITPNKRLNETQTDALATLAQAGWLDKPTALSVMMTGAWPPGKDPRGIKKIQAANDVTYGITEDGNYFVIQDHSKSAKDGVVPNREFNEERIGWITEGISSQFPNMEEGNVNQLAGIVFQDPSYFRSRFNVTSQEDMRKLGTVIAQSKTIAGARFTQMQDDGPLFFKGNTKDAPTTAEIVMDPQMRARLATDLEIDYTPMPDIKDIDGVDDEEVRQNLREGRAGPVAAQRADEYTTAEAMEVFGRNKLMELDAAGRLEIDAQGNMTILPAPEE